jgi:hypothetical protein
MKYYETVHPPWVQPFKLCTDLYEACGGLLLWEIEEAVPNCEEYPNFRIEIYPNFKKKFVDNLELTVTFSVGWADLTGFSCFAYCSRQLKITIFNVLGRHLTIMPSLAANKEGRTFGDEKGCRAARCDGLIMRNLLFQFLLDSVQKLCSNRAPSLSVAAWRQTRRDFWSATFLGSLLPLL